MTESLFGVDVTNNLNVSAHLCDPLREKMQMEISAFLESAPGFQAQILDAEVKVEMKGRDAKDAFFKKKEKKKRNVSILY